MVTWMLNKRLLWLAEGLLLVGAVGAAAWMSNPEEWRPFELVVLLLALALVGQRLIVEIRGQHLTASFIAVVLAMSLLGPAPAVLVGIAAMALTSATRRVSPALWLNNLSAHAAFTVLGGLMVRALIGNVHAASNLAQTKSVAFAFVVFAVFMVTNALNFALVAVDVRVTEGRSLMGQLRDLFVPLLPGQVAAGALAAVFAVAYTNLGLSAAVRRDPRAVDLPVPDDRAAALRGPRRSAGSALDPPRLAAARRAQHARGDARAARPHDRPPRGGGRALRARAREGGRLRRGRAGSRPHGRPAARHRQVRAARTASCTPRSSPTRTGR